jgi:hypothetical protein
MEGKGFAAGGDLPFVVGRGPVAGKGLPPLPPDLKLDDIVGIAHCPLPTDVRAG